MATGIVKRIVCLANSRKFGGRCVAGKEINPNGTLGVWVRPVTNQGNGEVTNWECQYPDGTEPKVLDVLDISATWTRTQRLPAGKLGIGPYPTLEEGAGSDI